MNPNLFKAMQITLLMWGAGFTHKDCPEVELMGQALQDLNLPDDEKALAKEFSDAIGAAAKRLVRQDKENKAIQ